MASNASNHNDSGRHPEALEGEIVLRYFSDKGFFNLTAWKTKRRGKDIPSNGSNGESRFPVFVQESEVREAIGQEPEKMMRRHLIEKLLENGLQP